MGDLGLKVNGKSFTWRELHEPEGLKSLFACFLQGLESRDATLCHIYREYLNDKGVSPVEESEIIVKLAPHVSRFLVELFGIQKEFARLREGDLTLHPVFIFKKDFVQRRVLKKYKGLTEISLSENDLRRLVEKIVHDAKFSEAPEESLAGFLQPYLAIEKKLKNLEKLEASEQAALDKLAKHVSSLIPPMGRPTTNNPEDWLTFLQTIFTSIEQFVATIYFSHHHQDWVSLHLPQTFDYHNLVTYQREDKSLPLKIEALAKNLRLRDGFTLTDKRMSQKFALGEVDYCIYCHSRDKDSCAKGLRHNTTRQVLKNPLDIVLNGCPLDEKISEAHVLRKQGDSLAALAAIIIDNPMVPGTGHRICNDCMKACIFQKQDPVNIPQIETNILTQVLQLPYGFEIYSLLTRWNPLNRKRPYALPYNGKNILVVGMGPAGYTLAHFLLNEGFGVVGIDGLKIEPLPQALTGKRGEAPPPIADSSQITENLDERLLAGFGGVAEYGITVRWDKNFLKYIYLTMARRDKFRVYGGVRFGGTVSIEDAWNLGFDHIAMATGAGKPTIVAMKNNLIRGVRKASDFLMALQLTGAFKRESLANLQVRLPAVVIGGGLTGIDTATELMAYYPVQVEKILRRFEILEKELGREKIFSRLTLEDQEILIEFLHHGRAARAEREKAFAEKRKPDFISLLRQWGGVSLVYRKGLTDSPAYRLNHEEVIKALEEGIYFVECLSPSECHREKYGELNGMTFEKQAVENGGQWRGTGEFIKLPARSVCVAAGTSPNTIYEREKPGTFVMDERKSFFQKFDDMGGMAKASDEAFFTSYQNAKRRITFYGDNHPNFAGNVVKAMASAKKGYPHVEELFREELKNLRMQDQEVREKKFQDFAGRLDDELIATVVDVVRLTPTIVEVIVRAKMAARNFHPGQFYRLQNYESDALSVEGSKLIVEGIALTGAWNDAAAGLLSMIILEMGTSSRLVATFKKGQRLSVMGPTGTPTHIPKGETVLLAGGGLGNAVLFSIGDALEHHGCRVIYFAGYRHSNDVFKQDEIESGTDVVVWANDFGPPISPRRPQDKNFTGNIVQAIVAYGRGDLGEVPIPLSQVDRIIAIGSDRMMAAVKEARHTVLKSYLKKDHVAVGSINSSMQCMMKEVCAQCLQKHVDPKTGEETKPVFSCFNQDQCLDEVDFANLNERLQMNRLQEVLSNLWLDHIFRVQEVPRL